MKHFLPSFLSFSMIHCFLFWLRDISFLLFLSLVPASAPRLVQQSPWYVLSCLWDGAYKRTLAANRKELLLSYYIQYSLRNSTIVFIFFRWTIQIAPNFLHWNAHIFLFWLNPTGHSKFHNTSNHPPPATDFDRTAHTPLYPHSLPLFFSCPERRN